MKICISNTIRFGVFLIKTIEMETSNGEIEMFTIQCCFDNESYTIKTWQDLNSSFRKINC